MVISMFNSQPKTQSHSSSNSTLDIDSIPSELQALPQFILCKAKRPVDNYGQSLAGWPDKGRSFTEVRELLAIELKKPEVERQFDGVGFMPKANGLMCIDIDHARDPNNNIKPEVDRLIKEIQAHGGWVEQSMSGNVHVWTRGLWPAPKSKKDGVEVFFGSGFVRLTGQLLEGYERGSIPSSPNPLTTVRHQVLNESFQSEPIKEVPTFEEFDRGSKIDLLVWTLDRVEQKVIPRLPEPYAYDLWFKVACGLKHQFGDEALELFHEYSSMCPEKYSVQGTNDLWRSIKDVKGANSITLRTVLQLANLSESVLSTSTLVHTEDELDAWFPRADLSLQEPRALNYVIDGLIAEGIFVIAGAPGSGKSSLLFHLATAVAHLCPSDYALKPLYRRHVVYITEDPVQATDMLYAMQQWGGMTQSQEEINEWLTIREGRRTESNRLADIVRLLVRTKTRTQYSTEGKPIQVQPLILFDTAASTFDLDNESDNSQVSRAISAVKFACSEQQTPLWISAHTAKVFSEADTNLSARGAGAWTGDVHGTAYVCKPKNGPDNERVMTLGKIRYEAEFRSITFKTETHKTMVKHPLGHLVDRSYRVGSAFILSDEAILQRAKESAKESTQRLRIEILKAHLMLSQTGLKITRAAIKKHVTGKGQTVTDSINTLLADGHLFDSKDGLLKGDGALWEECTRGDFSI
ncbi:MAG: hypothetical protein B7Y59_12920 [Burkholderiales bacterium 35-55-47]|nr:MAG: hypothetical protein B7Y59_12920 [Burkholderiales bacterium 35-55-47]OYZ72874.1 MAG: hypothetical protein B7Y06_08415 [Burkholderiales bacterium 24-55-52]OZA99454.1 MAG: hypothetical protein B7X62_11300 [Burkholderiales bacterium 39-55-53]